MILRKAEKRVEKSGRLTRIGRGGERVIFQNDRLILARKRDRVKEILDELEKKQQVLVRSSILDVAK